MARAHPPPRLQPSLQASPPTPLTDQVAHDGRPESGGRRQDAAVAQRPGGGVDSIRAEHTDALRFWERECGVGVHTASQYHLVLLPALRLHLHKQLQQPPSGASSQFGACPKTHLWQHAVRLVACRRSEGSSRWWASLPGTAAAAAAPPVARAAREAPPASCTHHCCHPRYSHLNFQCTAPPLGHSPMTKGPFS